MWRLHSCFPLCRRDIPQSHGRCDGFSLSSYPSPTPVFSSPSATEALLHVCQLTVLSPSVHLSVIFHHPRTSPRLLWSSLGVRALRWLECRCARWSGGGARVSACVQLTAASTSDVQIGVIVRISARCAAFQTNNKLQPMPESTRYTYSYRFCLLFYYFV